MVEQGRNIPFEEIELLNIYLWLTMDDINSAVHTIGLFLFGPLSALFGLALAIDRHMTVRYCLVCLVVGYIVGYLSAWVIHYWLNHPKV